MDHNKFDRHQEVLKDRHAALDTAINKELGRPQPDEAEIKRLKVRKLHIKETIEGVRPENGA